MFYVRGMITLDSKGREKVILTSFIVSNVMGGGGVRSLGGAPDCRASLCVFTVRPPSLANYVVFTHNTSWSHGN